VQNERDLPFLEPDLVRSMFSSGGAWARASGGRVRQRRKDLGLTLQRLADLSGTTVATVQRVESGALIPREHLKASIAYSLVLDVSQIWTYPSRQDLALAAAS
jgi:transcriptional regulator with XRE-family HTH domain